MKRAILGALGALAALALRLAHGAEDATLAARTAARDTVQAVRSEDVPADKALTVAQAVPGNDGGAGAQ
jgi:hypothetical protein